MNNEPYQLNSTDMKGRCDKAIQIANDIIEDLDGFSVVEVRVWVLETLLKKIHAEELFAQMMAEEINMIEQPVTYLNKKHDADEWTRVAAMLYKAMQSSPIGYTFNEWMYLGEEAVKAYEELAQ